MTFTGYKMGGPLAEAEKHLYVSRVGDDQLIKNLQSMNYVLVIEPRQQGKTSLIHRLIYQNLLQNYAIVYIDVSSCDHVSQEGWYRTLCERIVRQLQSKFNFVLGLPVPTSNIQWRSFLSNLALGMKEKQKRLVIVLDEIGSADFPGVSEFFIVLRDIYNSREVEKEFRELTFILVGTFHPRKLIKDAAISPFNIAQQIKLDDFNLDQIQFLLLQSEKKYPNLKQLSEKISFWTNGQPYLTQLLCSHICQNGNSSDGVDKLVNFILKEDQNHIPSIMMRLNASNSFLEYTNRVLVGEKIKYFPGVNPTQEEIRLLGLIKDDEHGYCCLRNRIYQLALKTHTQIAFDVFMCHNSSDKAEVKRISKRLKDVGVAPWLDEWELPPGLPWQRLLEAQIEQIKSVAVFVGENGIGPWQQMEMEAFLREFVKRGCSVIPVLLPSAPITPTLPVFLAGMTWVDFRQKNPDPMKRLIWGISGKKP